MGRVSIPNIIINPNTSRSFPPTSPAQAIERLVQFLAPSLAGSAKGTAVLTGAGVSVDSGIRAYRGEHGRYINPNYKPIFYHELVNPTEKGFAFRQRYWLRSYLGYPPVRDALPNTTHFAIAAGMHSSIFKKLVTQNVDGLHTKAIKRVWNQSRIDNNILELHGTLFKVHCDRGHIMDRNEFQELLSVTNPQWKAFADDLERTGQKPRTNPDGDVALEGVSYDKFAVPDCPSCLAENRKNSFLKPEVVFFGESISGSVKERSLKDVDDCDRLLVVGTTLATYSAFRIVKHALEMKKPVFLLNVGPTRADGLDGIEKVEVQSGQIMSEVIRALVGSSKDYDPVLRDMLTSGVVTPPPVDDDDRAPRAAG